MVIYDFFKQLVWVTCGIAVWYRIVNNFLPAGSLQTLWQASWYSGGLIVKQMMHISCCLIHYQKHLAELPDSKNLVKVSLTHPELILDTAWWRDSTWMTVNMKSNARDFSDSWLTTCSETRIGAVFLRTKCYSHTLFKKYVLLFTAEADKAKLRKFRRVPDGSSGNFIPPEKLSQLTRRNFEVIFYWLLKYMLTIPF